MTDLRIDAHHHVWDLAVRDQPWTADVPALRRSFTFGELRPQLAAAGVGGTVLVQTITVADETPEFLRLAAQHPEIVGVVGWIDLTDPACADLLAHLQDAEGGRYLVGIRHQVQNEPDHRWLLRDDVTRGLAAVAKAGLVYDLLVTPEQLPAAVETVGRNPAVRFVLDHAGNPDIAAGDLSRWRRLMSSLAALDNIDVKLSGLFTRVDSNWGPDIIRPYVHTLLELFGAERIMFGSDWPVSTLRADYVHVAHLTEQLLSGCSTPHEAAAIFGATARRVYSLDSSGFRSDA